MNTIYLAGCGTAWEIGYGVALRKPVFAYSSNLIALANRILIWHRDGDELRECNGNLIEHFGLPENLMVACSVQVICASADAALQQCAKHLRSGAQ